jgi:hypothetical protein
MSCVLPGVCDVLANPFFAVSILMSDDLPTFDRPIKAYSGFTGGGSFDIWVLLQMNSADFTIIVQS